MCPLIAIMRKTIKQCVPMTKKILSAHCSQHCVRSLQSCANNQTMCSNEEKIFKRMQNCQKTLKTYFKNCHRILYHCPASPCRCVSAELSVTFFLLCCLPCPMLLRRMTSRSRLIVKTPSSNPFMRRKVVRSSRAEQRSLTSFTKYRQHAIPAASGTRRVAAAWDTS